MKLFTIFALFLSSNILTASESGYLHMGKNHILYKDGVSYKDPLKEKRSPAAFKEENNLPPEVIRYEVDSNNGVVCYWRDKASVSTPLTCLKK